MKKNFLIIILVVISLSIHLKSQSLSNENYVQKPFEITISFIDTVYFTGQSGFWLTFKNLTDKVQYVRSRFCYGKDGIMWLTDSLENKMFIKLRINEECEHSFISLKSKDSVKLLYPYSIDSFYELKKDVKYNLYLEYWGHINFDSLLENESADSMHIKSNKLCYILKDSN
jgi:hypothetical protein